jgi:Asp/Glu/hydantoin racemase
MNGAELFPSWLNTTEQFSIAIVIKCWREEGVCSERCRVAKPVKGCFEANSDSAHIQW